MLICLPYLILLIYKRGHKGIRPTGVNRASPVVLSESPETFQIRPRHGGYIYLVLLIGLLYFHRRGYFLLDALSLSHLYSSSLGVFGDLLFAPFAQAYALCLGMQPLGWGLRHGREGYLAVGMDE